MSIESEINRLKRNIANAFNVIADKGGNVSINKVSGNLAYAISSIPTEDNASNGMITSMQIKQNTSITPEITNYISDVVMEGEGENEGDEEVLE